MKRSLRIIYWSRDWNNESFRGNSSCVRQGRNHCNTRRFCRKREEIPVNDLLRNRRGTSALRSEMAKTRNPAKVNLGRRSLVTELGKTCCDAIHLAAERPAAEAPEHRTIRKIQLEHPV